MVIIIWEHKVGLYMDVVCKIGENELPSSQAAEQSTINPWSFKNTCLGCVLKVLFTRMISSLKYKCPPGCNITNGRLSILLSPRPEQHDTLTIRSCYHMHGKLVFNWRLMHPPAYTYSQAQHLQWRNRRRGGGGQGAECPQRLLTGKFIIYREKEARKKGKRGENWEEEKDNYCKREGGKLKNGRWKSYKMRRGLFFSLLSIQNHQEKAFHAGKKIRKNDFAPSEKFSCYDPEHLDCVALVTERVWWNWNCNGILLDFMMI